MLVAFICVLFEDVGVVLVWVFTAFKDDTDKLPKLRVRVTRVMHMMRRLRLESAEQERS